MLGPPPCCLCAPTISSSSMAARKHWASESKAALHQQISQSSGASVLERVGGAGPGLWGLKTTAGSQLPRHMGASTARASKQASSLNSVAPSGGSSVRVWMERRLLALGECWRPIAASAHPP